MVAGFLAIASVFFGIPATLICWILGEVAEARSKRGSLRW